MEEQDKIYFFNPVPLIPPLDKDACPDTSHVIREEFQDTIGQDEFSIDIAKNLVHNNTENQYLKQCGIEVEKVHESLQTAEEDLTHAELCVMESQAKYLVDNVNKELNKNVAGKIYPEIDPDVVRKYYLLQADDILPHMYQRILSNYLSPFEFIFKDPCPSTETDEAFISDCCGKPITYISDEQKLQLKHLQMFAKRKPTAYEDDLNTKLSNEIVFDVHPKQITFHNFALNIFYEKQLYLKNITSKLQRIVIPKLSKESRFYVRHNKATLKVAPGMCTSFTIGFMSDTIDQCHDRLVIHVIGYCPICIELGSYKDLPFLKGLVYHKEFMDGYIVSDKIKNTVYNYTIDCGTVLYGCNAECTFIIQNTGGEARFFFIAEQDWINRDITCVTDQYKLLLEDFKISPAYFKLEKLEICELKFEFWPTKEGLIVDKLFLVSDNNFVEEIDIIGDCICYEPGFFTFQMPECPFTPNKEEFEVKHVLHMGAIYTDQTIVAHFYMYNKSLISIPFECRIEEMKEIETYSSVKKTWVKLVPNHGTILPLSGKRFEVRVKMESKHLGLFKFFINIFAIDIPENSLSEGPNFTFGEEYRSKDLIQKLLTILADKIEVQIHHINLPIHIYPEEICLPKLLYKTITMMSNLNIMNDGFCCFTFNWIQKERNNRKVGIKIIPNAFKIEAKKKVTCTVYIKLKTYDDVDETLTLSINDGFYEKDVRVVAKIEKPRLTVSKTFINFNHVILHENVQNTFTIKNMSEVCLCWKVEEYQYDFNIHKFVETDISSLSSISGELCQIDDVCEIVYKLDTSVPRKFFALLVFFTVYKYEKYEGSHVFLIGQIHEPCIRLEACFPGEDIFKIEDIYYVKETITKTFELHNDSIVPVNYYWGAPSGFHSKHVKFTFDYNKGTIPPNSRKNVNITLMLQKSGIVFDLYVPCSIQSLPEPIMLQILCVIKRPQVIFYIPSISNVIKVLWPTDYEQISEVSYEADRELKTFATHSDSKSMDFSADSTTTFTMNNLPSTDKQMQQPNWTNAMSDIFEYLKKIQMQGEQQTPIEMSSIDYESSHTVKSDVCLFSKFASETSICEYAMYFFEVKCKKVCSQTFEIENPMSVPLKFNISLKHFKAKDFKRRRLENILIHLNWKEDDSYSKQLSDHGIVVIVEPISGVLTNESNVTVKISVFAETWGCYLEELSVEIEHIPIFYMNVVIQIIGEPIEIPSMIKPKHIMQFNNVHRCMNIQERKLSLYNCSTIPILIVWHAFAKTLDFHDQDPFNVLYDIFGFDSEPNDNARVKIIKYVGEEIRSKFQLYTVKPKELYIQPKQTKQITIMFDPQYYKHTLFDVPDLKGVLIGNIHIEKKYSNDSNFVIRNPNKDLQVIKIGIQTCVTIASLDITCIRGDKDISMDINNVLNGVYASKKMRLIFQNDCNSDIVVSMNVTEPFQVISMRSNATETTITNNDVMQATVLFKGCLEVTINCEIMHDYLMNIADVLYSNAYHYLKGLEILTENQIQITRLLKISHQCNLTQEVPISVNVYFPLITVSNMNVNFGKVCLNSTKHLTFKILNKTASKTWFEIMFVELANIFKTDKTKGYLEPYTVCEKSLYLIVSFRPTNNIIYQDVMRIKTKIPQYYIDVTVTGTGTYNEKYTCERSYIYKCFKLEK